MKFGTTAAPPPRRQRTHRLAGLAVIAALASAALVADLVGQQPGLAGGMQLTRVYDAILDARFGDVSSLLATTCSWPGSQDTGDGAVPSEACGLLEAVATWWRIEIDPGSRAHDEQFLRLTTRAIDTIEAWTRRQPENADAWFYLGGAYGVRAQWRALRREPLAAARDGAHAKNVLERSLSINPALSDAYFGIGLYRYLADVVSGPRKILRWLLVLPGGDRAGGMRDMLRARAEGQLLTDEADYQLHRIYLWYENEPEQALTLLRGLRDRHPRNPLFWQLIAEVEDVYQQNPTSSRRSWERLLDAARNGQVSEAALAETRAHLGIAKQLDATFETDAALPHLHAVIDARAAAPVGALAEAYLALGQALDRLGQRTEAIAAYRSARTTAPTPDTTKIFARATTGLRRAPDATAASAYRLSLEGLRALERADLHAAARALSQALAIHPDDLVTKYRQGRLFLALRRDAEALAVFEDVGGTNPSPPTIQAEALVDAAQLREKMGERERAIELYQFARTVFGADPRTIERAERSLTRLGESSSTRRAPLHAVHARTTAVLVTTTDT